MATRSRWWLQLLVIGLVGLGSGTGGAHLGRGAPAEAQDGAIVAQSITTRQFQITDADGKVRMFATVSDSGEIYANLRDKDETPLLVLSLTAEGRPSVEVREHGTWRRAQMMVDNGAPTYALFDRSNHLRAYLGMDARSDVPFLQIIDANGQPRMYFGQYTDSVPHIDISDAGGDRIWMAP